jgi:alkyl hydroperoxide reductase subunit AhpF
MPLWAQRQAPGDALAAAADLNKRNITTATGARWRAMQVIRARKHLDLTP